LSKDREHGLAGRSKNNGSVSNLSETSKNTKINLSPNNKEALNIIDAKNFDKDTPSNKQISPFIRQLREN
jgi:hypothetical protein